MSAFDNFKYSVPIPGSQKKGESAVYRAGILNGKNLTQTRFPGATSLQKPFLDRVKSSPDRQFIFQRNPKNNNQYEGITYQQSLDIAKKIGSGLINLGLVPEFQEWRNFKLKTVAIHSKNRKEWLLVDIGASWLYGISIVPLYDTLGPEAVTYQLNHSGPRCVFADQASATILLKNADIGKVSTIVLFDDATPEQTELAKKRNLKLLSLLDLAKAGSKEVALPTLTMDTIFTFSYTSGTTGTPKGVLLSHANALAVEAVFHSDPKGLQMKTDDVYLSYLPLPHVFDRAMVLSCALGGAQVYFYGGDVQKLVLDIQDSRPSIFISVPRLFNLFHDKIKASFLAKTAQEQAVINAAINEKMVNLKTKNIFTHPKWDPAIFDKVKKSIFGDRVRIMITGSAPISPEVIDFLRVVTGTRILEGYGQTESTAASFLQHIDDGSSGNVGGPSVMNDFKVVDVPEMNYLSTDKDEKGVLTPRGEICLKGPSVFVAYYKEDEKTKETIDEDGWLHTGDIGKVLPNGSLKIIDRKKNIFKLAQGEYVAPEKIEGVYKTTKGVSEVFVYGDSLRSYCVGVIVPDPELVKVFAKELGLKDQPLNEMCKQKALRVHYFNSILEHGKKQGLFGFEQIKNLSLEPQSLQANGVVTSTMKLQRHLAKDVFAKYIKDMYDEGTLSSPSTPKL